MTSSASISGLASGLDTASIISQLMQLEAAPQTRLKARVSTEQAAVTTLQNLNAKLASLASAAAGLTKPAALNPMSASSSSQLVTATARADATAGTLPIVVAATALSHRLTFTTTAAISDVVTGGSTMVRLTGSDGTPHDLDTGDGTLRGLIGALNAAGTGVRASTVRLDDGTYRLRVESANTGAGSSFTLTALDGSDLLGGATVRAGQDAAIVVGTDTVHSATNTFTGVLPGVDVTLSPATAAGTAVDLTLAADPANASASVKALVDSVNAAIAELDSAARQVPGRTNPLGGDHALRSIRSELSSSLFPADGSSLATLGIQLDRDGRVTFDAEAFAAACTADPAAVTTAICGSGGFAERVQSVAARASDAATGTLTAAISGHTTQINRFQDSIDGWDTRLALRKETLTRQFTALETALSQLQAQSSWLSSQISSLSSSAQED